MPKNLLLASTSTLYGGTYLEYLMPVLEAHFANCEEILFIPYARPGGISHEAYTKIVEKAFAQIGKKVKGIHEAVKPKEAIAQAEGIFTGGGNTFVLVKMLYSLQLMEPLRQALHSGTPYLGTSAGSNICGLTIQTTNDMPIVYPPSFKTLGMLACNINPHYMDPPEDNTHMGETREQRIKEYHAHNTPPVIGLREGSWLEIANNAIFLRGKLTARVFKKDLAPFELATDSLIDFG